MQLQIALLFGIVFAHAFSLCAAEPPAAKPNILFILVDDQSPFDLKVYNPQSQLDSPHISKLASDGMVLDGAYHMGSYIGGVCTPSRYMIMSGRTLWCLPIGPEGRGECPPQLERNTLPAVFNRAGYDTFRTCKSGNSYEDANKQFTQRKDAMKREGTEEGGSAWHARQVLSYLDQRETHKERKPFLIYFGFSHPHDPRNGSERLLEKYGAANHTDSTQPPSLCEKQPPLPPNYLPAHPFNHGHAAVRDEVAVSGVWKRRDPATVRNESGRAFACDEAIDTQIGRVLDRLKAMVELDNTYIVYTADHGIAVGRHGLMGKQNLYEHTWRVPFIVKGPGIRPGARARGNVYLLDTLATLCDLAGIAAPESNQGISFKPVLFGKSDTVRDTLYGAYCGGDKPGIRAVRSGDWKLIAYDVAGGTVREKQLFNLAQNPNEFLPQHHATDVTALTGIVPAPDQTNLAGDPRFADKLLELERLLDAEMKRLQDPFRLWFQPEN